MPIALQTKLAILQQSEYEWPRYVQWLAAHRDQSVLVEPKAWTLKLRLLRLLAPILTLHGALLLLEIPKRLIFWGYRVAAQLKLRYLQARGLQVVAIAGSYAKTSTKYIAHHVLSTERRVVMTPENINTPIGISRLILSTLTTSDEIFIAELGEYVNGDIAALVRFLSPDYKILTPVGYAHLERFGSEANLQRGLKEILTTQAQRGKHFVYGHDYGPTHVHDVSLSRAGTEYVYQGTSYFIPLFGEHNAVNTLPAIWLASQFRIDPARVQDRLATLPAIPHRLEPTLLEHNILLLDNGYNSNPESARQSLQVLASLEGSQRIVTTPGFIELGDTQGAENTRLGEEIAKVADICVVIKGVNQEALLHGLYRGKMPAAQIYTAASEVEAMELLTGKIKPNAIILFENSIPELYQRR